MAMCTTATFGGWPAAPNAAIALAFQVRTMPEFAACADGAPATGAITPTTATIDPAKSALSLMVVPSLSVLHHLPRCERCVPAGPSKEIREIFMTHDRETLQRMARLNTSHVNSAYALHPSPACVVLRGGLLGRNAGVLLGARDAALGRRFEWDPADAVEPDLRPYVGVLAGDAVRAVGVELAGCEADRHPGGDSEGPGHHRERRRELFAESA